MWWPYGAQKEEKKNQKRKKREEKRWMHEWRIIDPSLRSEIKNDNDMLSYIEKKDSIKSGCLNPVFVPNFFFLFVISMFDRQLIKNEESSTWLSLRSNQSEKVKREKGRKNNISILTILETVNEFTAKTTRNAINWPYARLLCNRFPKLFKPLANWTIAIKWEKRKEKKAKTNIYPLVNSINKFSFDNKHQTTIDPITPKVWWRINWSDKITAVFLVVYLGLEQFKIVDEWLNINGLCVCFGKRRTYIVAKLFGDHNGKRCKQN